MKNNKNLKIFLNITQRILVSKCLNFRFLVLEVYRHHYEFDRFPALCRDHHRFAAASY